MDPFSDPFYLEYVRSQQEGYASAQRKARASISSLSSAEIAFVQSRTAVLVTSFRQRYEAARTFDLDDDMLFCPNLLTDSDWHEFWGKRFYAHNNIPRFQELNPLQIYPRSEFTETTVYPRPKRIFKKSCFSYGRDWMLFLLLVVGCFLRWLCRARIDEDTEQNPPDEGYEHTESYPQEDAAAEPNNSDEGYESNPSEDENADTAPKPPGHGNKNTEPDSSNNGNVNTESASHDNHHESLELSIYLDGFYHQPAKSFNHPVRRFLLFLHHCFLSLISFLLGETTIS